MTKGRVAQVEQVVALLLLRNSESHVRNNITAHPSVDVGGFHYLQVYEYPAARIIVMICVCLPPGRLRHNVLHLHHRMIVRAKCDLPVDA